MAIRLDELSERQKSEPLEQESNQMRLGDVASLERSSPRTEPEYKIQGVEPLFPDILEKIPQKQLDNVKLGKIGFMEQWRRQDKTEMIPFNPEGAAKAIVLLQSVNRLKNENTDPNQRRFDELTIQKYLTRLEEERQRGFTIGGRVMQGVAELPSFMIEFLATGPVASLGRIGVRKAVSGQARRIVQSGVLKTATRTIGGVAGATMRTAAMPHRLAKGFAERQVGTGLELTDKGIKLAPEVQEKPHISAMKAFGDVLIENFSEVTGPALRAGVSKFIPKNLKTNLENMYKRLVPNAKVRDLWTKAGFDGFLEELGEERVGAFLRAMTGVESFGAENPDNIFDRIISSIPNGEELLVEALVLGVPSAARMGTSQVVDLIQKRKKEDKVPEPEIREIPIEEVNEIAEAPKVADVPRETTEPVPEVEEPAVTEEETLRELETFFEEEGKALTSQEIRDIEQSPEFVQQLQQVEQRGVEGVPIPERLINREAQRLQQEAGQGEVSDFRDQAEQNVRQDLSEFSRRQPGIKTAVRRATGQTTGEQRTVTPSQALKESLRSQERISKQVRRMTRQEIKDAQNELINLLRQSDLEAKDRDKFQKTIRDIQSQEDLAEEIGRIRERIADLEERSKKRALVKKVNTELKKTKVRKVSGRPVGRFTADIQEGLDALREASKLSQEEAEVKIISNLTKHGGGVVPDNVLVENRALELAGGLKEKSSKELQESLRVISGIKQAGRELSELMQTERKQRNERMRNQFIEEITAGQGLREGIATFGTREPSKIESFQQALRSWFADAVASWNDVTNIISGRSGKRQGESNIEMFSSVFNETRNEEEGKGNLRGRLQLMVQEAYGVETEKDIINVLVESHKPVDLGRFENKAGIEDNLILTKAQARKKWMEMKDPTLRETFEFEEGMAWTQEIIDAVNNFLTKEDKDFARAELQFYREYHETINPVYRSMYGVNLPFNEFYSPIQRDDIKFDTLEGFGDMMQEAFIRRGMGIGALKSRRKNVKPLKFTSDVEVLQRHITDMERFKNWAEKIRDLSAVYDSVEVKRAIEQEYGKGMNFVIKNFLDDFASGGSTQGRRIEWLDQWRIKTAQRTLALRPSILIKQLSSTPAFLETLSIKEFSEGVIDFWKAPVKNAAILKESGFLKFRGQNFERDIKAASQSDQFKAFRSKPGSFINRLMLNVQLGDQGAIMVGGWGVYLKEIKKHGDKKRALREFARVANAAQQSADLAEQSNFQRGGSIAKLFTMYLTTPVQYFRKEVGALRNLANGRIGVDEALKQFVIFHFLLPMIFQWISDFGRFKPKEQLRAAILGNLNGFFIVGDMVEAIVRKGLGLRQFPNEVAVTSTTIRDFNKLSSITDIEDIGDEDFWRTVQGALGITGTIIGAPLAEVGTMLEGLNKTFVDKEYRDGIGMIMGWSKFSLRDEKKKGRKIKI